MAEQEPWYVYDEGYNYDLCKWYDDECYVDDSWNNVYEYSYEDGEDGSYDTSYTDEDWELYRIQKRKGKGRKGKGKGKGGKGYKGFPLSKGYGKNGKGKVGKGTKGPKRFSKGKGGKGKGGKGKDFQGLCDNCGMFGHIATNCEHFNGNCNTCGQWDHRAGVPHSRRVLMR